MRKHLKQLFLAILLLGISVVIQANTKIYKVIKPDGTILYTDKPGPGAVPLEMNMPENVTPSLAPAPKQGNSVLRNNIKPQNQGNNASIEASVSPPDIRILSPRNEETIRNNAGEILIQGDTNKASVGEYQLHMDGRIMAEKKLPQFTLYNVPRGEHTIQIILVNKGKQLALSEKVTFYLHRASVFNR